MSSTILPRTQRMVHCLCQVRGPQKPPRQSWWLTDYDHETADSRWKSQWRTPEPLRSGALDKVGRYMSPARPTSSTDWHSGETHVSPGSPSRDSASRVGSDSSSNAARSCSRLAHVTMNRTFEEICDNSGRDPQNVRDKHVSRPRQPRRLSGHTS